MHGALSPQLLVLALDLHQRNRCSFSHWLIRIVASLPCARPVCGRVRPFVLLSPFQRWDCCFGVWANLAEAYAWSNQPQKAASAYERELDLVERNAVLRPQDAALLSELATLYAHRQLPEKARMNLAKALALAPDDSAVLINAAEASEVLGSRNEAIHYVNQGLAKGFSLDDLKKRYALQALLADSSFKTPASK